MTIFSCCLFSNVSKVIFPTWVGSDTLLAQTLDFIVDRILIMCGAPTTRHGSGVRECNRREAYVKVEKVTFSFTTLTTTLEGHAAPTRLEGDNQCMNKPTGKGTGDGLVPSLPWTR
jgi:hypothetical protein